MADQTAETESFVVTTRFPATKGSRSIAFKFSLFVFVLLLIMAGCLTAVSYFVARAIVKAQIHDRLSLVASDRHAMVTNYVAQQRERVNLVASRTRLRQLIEEYDNETIDPATMQESTYRILADAKSSTVGFRDIWITDQQGRVITGTDRTLIGQDFSGQPDFLQGQRAAHLGQLQEIDGRVVAYLCAPATTNDDRPLGVVMVLLDAAGLVKIISETRGLGRSGEVLIATRNGDRIRYLLPLRNRKEQGVPVDEVPIMAAAISGETNAGVAETRYEGVPVLASYQPIDYQRPEYQRWGLVAKINAAEAYEPVRRLGWMLLGLESAVIFVALVISVGLARRFVRPMLVLTKMARKVAAGDLEARVTVRKDDEIGLLAATFNHMTAEVAAAHRSLEQRVQERTTELTREVAERERAQRIAQHAREEAEQANQAKSEFLANMSHEIRTPINGVIGMAELMSHTKMTPEQSDYLRMIRESADALLRLLNDILDFSKIEAGKLELESVEFDIRDTVGKTGQTLAVRAAEKGLELACRIAPEIPQFLVGDPGRLRQIITNLAGNAIKFTNQGEVVIDVRQDSRTGDRITLHCSVRDTGIGIPKDKQTQIFEAFGQADASTTRKFGGTGLGLTISSQLVELMNGHIWLESVDGEGSTFHFTAEFGVGTRHHAPRDLSALQGKRVLIVDDNQTNRRIFEEMTRIWHMRPTSVDSAQAGVVELSKAVRSNEPYDIVLLDYMMPEIDGFGFVEKVRADKELVDTRIIMISSAASNEHREWCKKLGILRYMNKPVVQSDLLDALLNAFGARSAPEVESPQQPQHEKSLKILLAEDGLVNQRVAVGLLNRMGHHVTVASDGAQAVEKWGDERFDLVLMDIHMPKMDGFAATAAIREKESGRDVHTPIIAMTANAMKGDRETCLAAGMDDYIAKPIDRQELFRVLQPYIELADD